MKKPNLAAMAALLGAMLVSGTGEGRAGAAGSPGVEDGLASLGAFLGTDPVAVFEAGMEHPAVVHGFSTPPLGASPEIAAVEFAIAWPLPVGSPDQAAGPAGDT